MMLRIGDAEELLNEFKDTWMSGSDAEKAAIWHKCIDAMLPPESVWRCFHCGMVFTDRWVAQEHFGKSSDDRPVCFTWGNMGPKDTFVSLLKIAPSIAAQAGYSIAIESTKIQ